MSGFCRLVALTALVGLPELAVAQSADHYAARTAANPVIQTAAPATGRLRSSVTLPSIQPAASDAVWITGADEAGSVVDREGTRSVTRVARSV